MAKPMVDEKEYFILNPEFTNPKRLKKEREKARNLKKSSWWNELMQKGLCHYCGKKFSAQELTMDHIVPLARGGTSTRSNIVLACRNCNRNKKLLTPAEEILKKLTREKL